MARSELAGQEPRAPWERDRKVPPQWGSGGQACRGTDRGKCKLRVVRPHPGEAGEGAAPGSALILEVGLLAPPSALFKLRAAKKISFECPSV